MPSRWLTRSLLFVIALVAARAADLDRSFLPKFTWRAEMRGYDAAPVIAIQDDGKILVAGSFTHSNDQPVPGVIRLNPDGSPDQTFRGPDGIDYVSGITLGEDRHIYLQGQFVFNNRTSRTDRINREGIRDTNFHGIPFWREFAVQPHGSIIFSGDFGSYNGSSPYVAKLDSAGSVDLSFKVSTRHSPQILSTCGGGVYLYPDGKILLAGLFPGLPGNSLQRLLPDGQTDPNFARWGEERPFPIGGIVFGTHIQRNGQLVFTDNQWDGIKRLNANGSADINFKRQARAPAGYWIPSYSVSPDYRIYAIAMQGHVDTSTNVSLMRFHRDGTRDVSFAVVGGPGDWTTTESPGIGVRVQPDGQLLVYGNFRSFNGIPCSGLVRLKTGLLKSIVAQDLASETFRFTVVGNIGEPFIIEESTDLTEWSAVKSGILSTNTAIFEVPRRQMRGYCRIR